jgi:hypothetical protein
VQFEIPFIARVGDNKIISISMCSIFRVNSFKSNETNFLLQLQKKIDRQFKLTISNQEQKAKSYQHHASDITSYKQARNNNKSNEKSFLSHSYFCGAAFVVVLVYNKKRGNASEGMKARDRIFLE